jgi:outer membrane protein OmpA-like peptidoglycan-associated protein
MKSAFLAVVLVAFATTALGPEIAAQEAITSDAIIQALTPKPKTRSLSPDSSTISADDRAFVESLATTSRSITVEERKKVVDVIEVANLPAIDLEIYFGFDSAAIGAEAVPALMKLGQALTNDKLKGSIYLLGGHTDAKGADDYNQALSEKRAAAVRDFLEQNFGIPAQQLVSAGFGEEKLKNANDPEAAENRRVQVVRLSE